jgi:DUF3089 family protein
LLVGSAALACVGLAGVAVAGNVPHWKVWLCSPSAGRDWCNLNLSTTVVGANGRGTVTAVATPKTRPVDCFYVYPTVSEEKRGNADLRIQQAEKLAAASQGAQFERVCRVFAPMYRQVPGNGDKFHPNYNLEYEDVLAAWRDYLAHDNHGRGVVLIGHSEGAFVLKRLIRDQIEGSPSERKLLVSAIMLGGNVTVADGSDTGGDFRSVPACAHIEQTGCVVAYSSWDRTPPKNAAFQNAGPGKHVLCVNPAALAGGTAPITPVFLWFYAGGILSAAPTRQVDSIFMSFPGLYTAHCVQQGSRAWLRVERVTLTNGDPRPTVQEVLSPNWGLHAADINIALGDLVGLVRAQSKAWIAHH